MTQAPMALQQSSDILPESVQQFCPAVVHDHSHCGWAAGKGQVLPMNYPSLLQDVNC